MLGLLVGIATAAFIVQFYRRQNSTRAVTTITQMASSTTGGLVCFISHAWEEQILSLCSVIQIEVAFQFRCSEKQVFLDLDDGFTNVKPETIRSTIQRAASYIIVLTPSYFQRLNCIIELLEISFTRKKVMILVPNEATKNEILSYRMPIHLSSENIKKLNETFGFVVDLQSFNDWVKQELLSKIIQVWDQKWSSEERRFHMNRNVRQFFNVIQSPFTGAPIMLFPYPQNQIVTAMQ